MRPGNRQKGHGPCCKPLMACLKCMKVYSSCSDVRRRCRCCMDIAQETSQMLCEWQTIRCTVPFNPTGAEPWSYRTQWVYGGFLWFQFCNPLPSSSPLNGNGHSLLFYAGRVIWSFFVCFVFVSEFRKYDINRADSSGFSECYLGWCSCL